MDIDLATLDKETVVLNPHAAEVSRRGGKRHMKILDPRISVSMPTPGGTLILFFEQPVEGGAEPFGAFSELRLMPGPQPWRLIPRLPLYLNYARAVAAFRREDMAAALRALRDAGAGRRGHGDDFYLGVARMYEALVAAGEPSPITAIAESQPVTVSAASKWVQRARDLGMIKEENDASSK